MFEKFKRPHLDVPSSVPMGRTRVSGRVVLAATVAFGLPALACNSTIPVSDVPQGYSVVGKYNIDYLGKPTVDLADLERGFEAQYGVDCITDRRAGKDRILCPINVTPSAQDALRAVQATTTALPPAHVIKPGSLPQTGFGPRPTAGFPKARP